MSLPPEIVQLVDDYVAQRDEYEDMRDRGYRQSELVLERCQRNIADAMVRYVAELRSNQERIAVLVNSSLCVLCSADDGRDTSFLLIECEKCADRLRVCERCVLYGDGAKAAALIRKFRAEHVCTDLSSMQEATDD